MNKHDPQRIIDRLRGKKFKYFRIDYAAPVGSIVRLTKISSDTWMIEGDHETHWLEFDDEYPLTDKTN